MKKKNIIMISAVFVLLVAISVPTGICLSRSQSKSQPVTQSEPVQQALAEHTHALAEQANTVADPVSGYCGNTQTTLYYDGKVYSFMGGNSVTLTDMLINMEYDPEKSCKCYAEYKVDTEFGTGYELSVGENEGFARCEKGQADLTKEQLETVKDIIKRVKSGEVF